MRSRVKIYCYSWVKQIDDGVFDDFPKISEDFPKLFRIPDERSRTFSLNDTTLTKVTYGKYATQVPDEVAYGI